MTDEPRKRGTRGGKNKAFRGLGQVAFSGDGCNMRHGTAGGRAVWPEQLWWAHVGETKRGVPVMEPTEDLRYCNLGKYGTNTQFLQTPESFTGLVG